ncbi:MULTISPECIES: FIST signal transduction protein [unclassified Colwellia]|uniref:FIST signal transduction protein n=1 Tax=unclassified Colwellia TaxID=196834 RepID=UPI0015F47830|nr:MULTISPECIES: FIST N-terminal domain-containing protein [unclassified Colwellia]MBA6232734.1 FIST C-terminal domain-containing protein [Colwellia sp. MB02u-7]MBA6236178.1 FIST C-terminal domain-containing protein [Colwellia sp. MB02u-11]MBA6256570.1 FIST C-terminal domain-containing protein [Colwellia sp. MB3u-28]MBA6261285.1 FIST C-terminal domain-containing protein [Colwellia sp. MB3u-41]MBA6298422.1 FIST C-terminal domain-containing protein [Colwellia sp. MB3u-22]
MKFHQNTYLSGRWESPIESIEKANLVLLFGNRDLVKNEAIMADIRCHYPKADIIGCTTAGEIQGIKIYDDSLCLTAIEFDHSFISVQSASITNSSVLEVVKNLADGLDKEGLRYVMVLSDGHQINGTELVNALQASLPEDILITGGLAGDGTNFNETLVWHNSATELGQIVLVGFYGERLSLGYGCIGGWDAFGPDRTITKSKSNVLYELDNLPALALYKRYLGPHADDLPASALLFPLVLKIDNKRMTRTILSINEEDGSMTFAGDVPEGATVQLMRANTSSLIDGAEIAAEHALSRIPANYSNGLAILISCVGRRIVLGNYCEEEVEVVKDILGEKWAYTGFYSYGELSPMLNSEACALHNQTMTITTLCETDE